jgi:hypothetical protein
MEFDGFSTHRAKLLGCGRMSAGFAEYAPAENSDLVRADNQRRCFAFGDFPRFGKGKTPRGG